MVFSPRDDRQFVGICFTTLKSTSVPGIGRIHSGLFTKDVPSLRGLTWLHKFLRGWQAPQLRAEGRNMLSCRRFSEQSAQGRNAEADAATLKEQLRSDHQPKLVSQNGKCSLDPSSAGSGAQKNSIPSPGVMTAPDRQECMTIARRGRSDLFGVDRCTTWQ
jgi:hypothetical protein